MHLCELVECRAVPLSKVQCSAGQCRRFKWSAVQCSVVEWSAAVEYSGVHCLAEALPCSVVPCRAVDITVQRGAVSAVRRSSLECSAVGWNAVECIGV